MKPNEIQKKITLKSQLKNLEADPKKRAHIADEIAKLVIAKKLSQLKHK